MATWAEFEAGAPELAAFGKARFGGGVAYLATVKADGGPRVHPVTPIIGEGRLFLFMEPTSPKGNDLKRDRRYALHCAVENSSGSDGEFHVAGKATWVEDADIRALAVKASSYAPHERYILFELGVEFAASTVYQGDVPVRRQWRATLGGV
jgi:hypothetical protein